MAWFRRQQLPGEDFERAVQWGPTGWNGLPTPSHPQQNGRYHDKILSQVPGIWPSTQLRCGRPTAQSRWLAISASPRPSWQQAQQQANLPGAQRNAGGPGRGMGPIGARGLRSQVFRAQVQQSGLQAMSWAQALKGWN